MSEPAETAAPGSLKGETALHEPTRYERTVARRSAEIRATVPDAEFRRILDAEALLGAAERDGVPALACVLGAAARALRAVPALNGAYRDGRLERYSRVNLGVVIAAEGLYAVPTIFDADVKSVNELADELLDLQARARADRLESAELTGATFTVTDVGEHGLAGGAPLILGGQAGGLGVGVIRAAAVVRGDRVVAGHELELSLVTDHRAVQVPGAGAYLSALAAELGAA